VYVLVGEADARATTRAVNLAAHCSAAGHHAILLTDRNAVGSAASGLVHVVQLGGGRDNHRYFCDEQRDADLVHDSLLALGCGQNPSSLFFVGCAPAAMTVVRSRRLLGAFAHAAVVLVEEAPEVARPSDPPATLPSLYRRWAAGYVRGRADGHVTSEDAPSSSAYRLLPPHPVVEPPPVAPAPPPTVSVVIPLFNQGEFVREAIASAFDQGLPGLEVVVVDDGSTDPATVAVFDSLTDVTKVRQSNRGLSAARNAGIARARGRYIVPLDADDLLVPGFVPAAVEALDRNRELAYVVGHSRYSGLLDHVYVPAGFIPEVALFLHTHGKSVGVYRREALAAVGGYDEDFPAFEDWELQVALHRAGFETDVLPVEGQVYRRHAASMSFTTSNQMRPELLGMMIRKHAGMLPLDDVQTALLLLTRFWKTRYEPSASVLLQAGDR
jgi:hypothetical protein